MQKSILVMAFAALALAGCGDDEPTTRTESAPSAAMPETAPPPAEQSMEGSAASGSTGSDPSLPATDQVLQPANPSNTAQETTANPPDDLTKQESSENMPQPGSVHSYSTPVREQTDQTKPE